MSKSKKIIVIFIVCLILAGDIGYVVMIPISALIFYYGS